MIVTHVKPVDWVDTAEAGKIQPSAVAELVHVVTLEAADVETLRGPQGVPGADGAQGQQGVPGVDGAPGPSNLPSGDMVFSGVGQRIKGDFSDAIHANRVMFQGSVENGATSIHAIPNGNSTTSQFLVHNSSDPDNSSRAVLNITGAQMNVGSSQKGTGAYLPIVFNAGGLERARIGIDGLIEARNSAGLGYGAGSGGVVWQLISKTAEVVLNKASGQITMHNAALNAGESVYFVLKNSILLAADSLVLTGVLGFAPNYRIECLGVANGVAGIRVTNISAGSLSEALQINFAIIKGSTA